MSQESQPPLPRRKYLIDLRFQGKFIATAVLPLLLFVLVLAFAFLLAVNSIAREYQFENTAELIHKLSTTLGQDASSDPVFRQVKFWGLMTLAGLAVVVVISLTILFLFFSHRIAGPLLRIERTLEDALRGDLTQRIRLRAKDELHGTAQQINQMLDGLQAKIRRIDQMARNMHNTLEIMLEQTPAENKEQLLKLDDMARGVLDAISDFKLQ
ncbi:MAG: methyl-accepting chemotaxis protein [Turneriella sp.]|nr:methyl-accepting chemotaxis protein [Turneriella sp.]